MTLLFVGGAGNLWRANKMTVEIVFNDKTSFSIGDQRVALTSKLLILGWVLREGRDHNREFCICPKNLSG